MASKKSEKDEDVTNMQAYNMVAMHAIMLNNARDPETLNNIKNITDDLNNIIQEHGADALTLSMMTLHHQTAKQDEQTRYALTEMFSIAQMCLVSHEQAGIDLENNKQQSTPHVASPAIKSP